MRRGYVDISRFDQEGKCIYAYISFIFKNFISFSQISDASGASRSDDISKLKHSILTYMSTPSSGLDPVALSSKVTRGFRNSITAGLLCPLRLKARFLQDPEYVDEISVLPSDAFHQRLHE